MEDGITYLAHKAVVDSRQDWFSYVQPEIGKPLLEVCKSGREKSIVF